MKGDRESRGEWQSTHGGRIGFPDQLLDGCFVGGLVAIRIFADEADDLSVVLGRLGSQPSSGSACYRSGLCRRCEKSADDACAIAARHATFQSPVPPLPGRRFCPCLANGFPGQDARYLLRRRSRCEYSVRSLADLPTLVTHDLLTSPFTGCAQIRRVPNAIQSV